MIDFDKALIETYARRYRWLRMMAKEQLLNPEAAGSECPDMRTYWRIPTLICSGPVGGFIDFDSAIDNAMQCNKDCATCTGARTET